MPSNVRVTDNTWKTLREIATQAGESMQVILEKAVEDYRRKILLEEANKAYLALKNDSEAWQGEKKERLEWDETLKDNLEENE
ncbi:toxin-antitoxin system protein [Zhaonella formicivorans]|uniref:toxin-antitoxin system protein n=1 Tax=Zhaonella formicivorans TaxID=2528593 RepID=UPI0010E9BEF7|nr:toxin-antitoxin system protein [Zhaonella formicivorans]